MHLQRTLFLLLALVAMLTPAEPVAAVPAFTVDDRGVFVVFPDRVSFNGLTLTGVATWKLLPRGAARAAREGR